MQQRVELPVRLVELIGTDNVMIRLGDTLALRLPRIEEAAAGIAKEQQLVPRIAPHLPFPVLAPVGVGANRPSRSVGGDIDSRPSEPADHGQGVKWRGPGALR